MLDKFAEEIANFGSAPTMYAGLVDDTRRPAVVRRPAASSRMPDGSTVAADIRARDYAQFIGEAAHARFLPEGAVLQADRLSRRRLPRGAAGAPERGRSLRHALADAELAEFRQRCGAMVHSSFHYHYARLIELMHGAGEDRDCCWPIPPFSTRTCAPAPR